jgi:16S rRNA processing protein RimM
MLVAIGKVRSVHGLKGFIKAEAYTGSDRTLKAQDELFLGASESSCRLYKVEGLKGSPEDADSLKGYLIFIEQAQLPQLPAGSYYSFMLEGMEVETTEGKRLGKVRCVDHYPANDILTVCSEDGPDILIPAVKDIVRNVDMKSSKIIVEDRKGLR